MSVIALKCPDIRITVVDANIEKINQWNGSLDNLPVFEPGLKEVVEKTRNKNLFFSTDIKKAIEDAELIFVAVNTPTKTDGDGAGMAADLKYIESCAMDIAEYSKSNKIVVEKSTVPIKTAEKIKKILKDKNSKNHFEVLSNPEFLAEGTAIKDMLSPDRVLIGTESSPSGKKAGEKLVNIYSKWVDKKKILTTNVWSSELSKLASNAMLAQRVSSINSLSALCEKTDADIEELSTAIGMDNRIGSSFLKASVGFGGSCFQKDILNLVYLCRSYGLDEVAEFWLQVIKINNYQKERFVKKIFSISKKYGNKIGVLGWAFKANTNDSRESAAIYIVSRLLNNKEFKINIYDPMVSKEKIKNDLMNSVDLVDKKSIENINVQDSVESVYNNSGIIFINTEWDHFKEFKWLDKDDKYILDGRNILINKRLKNYFRL